MSNKRAEFEVAAHALVWLLMLRSSYNRAAAIASYKLQNFSRSYKEDIVNYTWSTLHTKKSVRKVKQVNKRMLSLKILRHERNCAEDGVYNISQAINVFVAHMLGIYNTHHALKLCCTYTPYQANIQLMCSERPRGDYNYRLIEPSTRKMRKHVEHLRKAYGDDVWSYDLILAALNEAERMTLTSGTASEVHDAVSKLKHDILARY